MPLSSKIYFTSWISKDEILMFLTKDWLSSQSLPIRFYGTLQNAELRAAPLMLFGEHNRYFITDNIITFIFYPNKEEENQKIYLAANFNGWETAINDERWLLKSQIQDKRKIMTLSLPWETISHHSELFFKFITKDKLWISVSSDAPNYNNNNYEIIKDFTGKNAFIIDTKTNYDPSLTYTLSWNENNENEMHTVNDTAILASLGSTQKLGTWVNEKGTTFRLFAPRAQAVQVSFYKEPQASDITQIQLKKNSDFTWETTWPESLHGYSYYYTVSKEQINDFPILDPYSIACHGPAGPGIIIDETIIPKINSTFKTPNWNDLIILEAHLRDLISSTPFIEPIEKPTGFKNFISWFNQENNYLKELGINAIEFLPIQEFEQGSPFSYHWGYMTTNYFCPSSAYSSKENVLSQITEFQELVEVLHKNKISVIMDVVYNHSGQPNHLYNIDEKYYFVTTKDGHLSNWSGCGNDFKANSPMGKRLIIDSLTHFIQTYNVDGFRFDLAELLGVEVLAEIETALKTIKPSIILIAEPWSFKGHIGKELKSTGFASWNDGYREFISEYVRGRSSKEAFIHYVTGSIDSLASFTTQSVNYGASHDDHCWIDKITENPNHDGSNPTTNDIQRTHLMIAILMMSIGIPMLAEGQDFLHSKQGCANTYQKENLNTLNYSNITKNFNTHKYFKEWIKFRLSKNGQSLRIKNVPHEGYYEFFNKSESTMIGLLYNANLSLKNAGQLLFVINPNTQQNIISVKSLKAKDFLQIADQDRFDSNGLKDELISWHEDKITLPALSCGLWINLNLRF